jgi:hypothetical protein
MIIPHNRVSTDEEIITANKDGWNRRQIREYLHVSPPRIKSVIGLSDKPNNKICTDEEIIAAYKKGKHIYEIKRRLHTSSERVKAVLAKAGYRKNGTLP